MKSPRSFRKNRFFSTFRFAFAGALLFAAAGMAFVATNSSGPLAVGKSNNAGKAKLDMRIARSRAFSDHLKTLLGPAQENGAERNPLEGAAQEAYDNQAYPAKSIAAAQRTAAWNSAAAIGRLSQVRLDSVPKAATIHRRRPKEQ